MQQPRREAPRSLPRSVPSRCGPECRTQHDIVYPPGIHIHPAAHRWRACSPYGGHHTRRECQWPAPAGAGSLESGRVSGRAVPLVGPSAGPRVVFRSFIDCVNNWPCIWAAAALKWTQLTNDQSWCGCGVGGAVGLSPNLATSYAPRNGTPAVACRGRGCGIWRQIAIRQPRSTYRLYS